MDPVSLAIGAVGLGMSIWGGLGSASKSHQISQFSQDQVKQEQAVQDAKLRQMELEGRRTQTENIRNMQRGRAAATQAGVNQGAQFGSGLQGGLAQVSDQGFWNMLGVNQALSTGREISGYNSQISKDKSAITGLQGEAATDQGIASIGGALMKAGPIIGQLAQGFNTGSGSYKTSDFNGQPGARNTGGFY